MLNRLPLLVPTLLVPTLLFATQFFATHTALRAQTPQNDDRPKPGSAEFPDLPLGLTSFGGARLGDDIFVYGGHKGDAHVYSMADQSNDLWRLRLAGEKRAWTKMSSGPRLQGLALVAFDKYLYRLGGFTARNKKGDEHDLWSQSGVARFDPVAKTWTKMPPLPEPRSSFDAAVVGDAIYVAGGWQMQGDGESVWHKTAYRLNLKGEPKWETLPEPPFQRRALALAAHGGRLYAIGGMQQKGGPTTRVDIFDPQAKKWSQGPALRGEPLTGFGSSSFATGGRLYVSAVDGSLQRLSKDGRSWESLKGLKTGRFFHRMLPLDERRLLVVGGANMSIGKVVETKVLAAD